MFINFSKIDFSSSSSYFWTQLVVSIYDERKISLLCFCTKGRPATITKPAPKICTQSRQFSEESNSSYDSGIHVGSLMFPEDLSQLQMTFAMVWPTGC